jgi:hypothetical protein
MLRFEMGILGPVRHALVLSAVVLTLVPASAAADHAASGKAKLQIVQGGTLVVRGTNFVPGERVRVRVVVGRTLTKRTTADHRGTFTVRFRTSYDRCSSGLFATAAGNRGSQARVNRPELMCPPRL